jgi:hypothetical protein
MPAQVLASVGRLAGSIPVSRLIPVEPTHGIAVSQLLRAAVPALLQILACVLA